MNDYELYHASNRKHKYIKKIGKRYFYTQQEIAAYLKEKRGQAGEFNEAVAEATGKRDVYFEAKKVTENGRTYYDDDNPTLRTGKKDKHGRIGKDGSVYTKNGTMQYDNNKTRRINEETRKQGRQKLKNMALKPMHDLGKQAARGKKAIDKWYTKATTPDISVTYDEPVIKSDKSSNSTKNTSKKSKKRQFKGNTQDLGSGLSVTYDEAVIKDDKSSKKKRRRG